ncbi:hypothetical protein ABLAC_11320 [Acinetobacter baumannii LAC-4]|nr:hypothetical protein BJAB0715_02732 [Acinetobacter baumannii BJAB0715]AIY36487.1 hypothetical protein ABLAC_11320 [Acinetobacter baumannii LAC-4]EXB92551.1 hypothetical protein J510_0278 [Acinetobacter baumannii 466760]EXE23961.1 hypothetical protein J561_0071 [Acinetobacter baumannii 50595]EXH96991.1 hypothetical protein J609_0638 [Acinetobacter baumannii 3390]EXQ83541.1 hypothetical protein J683_0729 [Acinetobacter baumannii 1007214]KCY35268.1 hypothetical protein J726_2524 [Acinetobacte
MLKSILEIVDYYEKGEEAKIIFDFCFLSELGCGIAFK